MTDVMKPPSSQLHAPSLRAIEGSGSVSQRGQKLSTRMTGTGPLADDGRTTSIKNPCSDDPSSVSPAATVTPLNVTCASMRYSSSLPLPLNAASLSVLWLMTRAEEASGMTP